MVCKHMYDRTRSNSIMKVPDIIQKVLDNRKDFGQQSTQNVNYKVEKLKIVWA